MGVEEVDTEQRSWWLSWEYSSTIEIYKNTSVDSLRPQPKVVGLIQSAEWSETCFADI